MKLEEMVIDDRERGVFRYHRSAMTSPEVLAQEWERIFNRCWLYLGHESEANEPGDYRRRTIAGRPLFFIRGKDGQVRVFFNTCRHRGALICRRDEGNGDVLQCFYHAWTYNSEGELIGVPDEAGYPPSFEKSDNGLVSPPRVETYRGLIFVSFNAEVEPLYDYLAGVREYIDCVLDQAEDGMRIMRGANYYDIKANWKLLIENSIDGYHAGPVHQTFFEYIQSVWPEAPRDQIGRGMSLGKGHTVIEYPASAGKPIAVWTPIFSPESKSEMAKVRARLVERFGEEYAKRLAEYQRNIFVYPNLIINDVAAVTVRYFEPVAQDRMRVAAWALAPREEAEELLATRVNSFISFLGPGGLATPDDTEALEACQAGFQATEVEWSDISRGTRRDPISKDELQMRGFWRKWYADMNGLGDYDHQDEPVRGEGLKAAV